jgi:hypothetical protein
MENFAMNSATAMNSLEAASAKHYRWEELPAPSYLPHSAVALEDTLDVDVFNPPRQDWLAGTDAYLRR